MLSIYLFSSKLCSSLSLLSNRCVGFPWFSSVILSKPWNHVDQSRNIHSCSLHTRDIHNASRKPRHLIVLCVCVIAFAEGIPPCVRDTMEIMVSLSLSRCDQSLSILRHHHVGHARILLLCAGLDGVWWKWTAVIWVLESLLAFRCKTICRRCIFFFSISSSAFLFCLWANGSFHNGSFHTPFTGENEGRFTRSDFANLWWEEEPQYRNCFDIILKTQKDHPATHPPTPCFGIRRLLFTRFVCPFSPRPHQRVNHFPKSMAMCKKVRYTVCRSWLGCVCVDIGCVYLCPVKNGPVKNGHVSRTGLEEKKRACDQINPGISGNSLKYAWLLLEENMFRNSIDDVLYTMLFIPHTGLFASHATQIKSSAWKDVRWGLGLGLCFGFG